MNVVVVGTVVGNSVEVVVSGIVVVAVIKMLILVRGLDNDELEYSFPHNISPFTKPNPMLWVLKRIVSLRRLF